MRGKRGAYQFHTILEACQSSGVMQEAFEFVVINVIFKFCEQSADEVSNEHHLSLQGAHNRYEYRFQRAGGLTIGRKLV